MALSEFYTDEQVAAMLAEKPAPKPEPAPLPPEATSIEEAMKLVHEFIEEEERRQEQEKLQKTAKTLTEAGKELPTDAGKLATTLLPLLLQAQEGNTDVIAETITLCKAAIEAALRLSSPQLSRQLLAPGTKFGCWTLVQERSERRRSGDIQYIARSDCGRVVTTFLGRELRSIPACRCKLKPAGLGGTTLADLT